MTRRVVIIGNGMAGARLQEELHRRDPAGEHVTSVVIGDEPGSAYNRILMSNVVAGRITPADTRLRADNWYSERNLQTHTGVRVERVDRDTKTVHCDDGTVHGTTVWCSPPAAVLSSRRSTVRSRNRVARSKV